jgi:transcriptional regulator with GAF, ATPase, and Fis domain
VKLNCAAIPLDLLESELFGHEKGAFTGAIAQRIGRFELADKGTLFLDEVGDIPPALQPKLLRVLQEQEFERLGGTRTHRVDVRLVAATNRDLDGMVKRCEFRSDLYYRLNVFPILLPPLRARREDILALVTHFIDLYSRRMGIRIEHIPPNTMSAFRSYQWPGNVRELQNLIERAVILSNDGVLANPLPAAGTEDVIISAAATTLRDSERRLILRTLEAVGWVIGGTKGAAAKLGLKRTTLIHKMKRLGISRPPPGSNGGNGSGEDLLGLARSDALEEARYRASRS